MKKNYLKLSGNQSNFHSLALKLRNLSNKIDELINSGKFWEFSKKEQDRLVSKLRRLFEKLSGFNQNYALKIAGAAMCFALISNTAKASAFSEWTPPFANVTGTFIDGAFADIDDDGDLDAILLNSAYEPIYFKNNGGVYEENEAENPFKAMTGSTSYFTAHGTGIDLANFDGDGDLDAILINSGNYIRHYELNSSQKFDWANSPLNGGSASSGFYIHGGYKAKFGDIDGDGDLDIIAAECGQGTTTLLQQTDHSFTKQTGYPVSNSNFYYSSDDVNLNMADMDGDGDEDLFVFDNSSSGGSPGLTDATGKIGYYENTLGSGDFVWNSNIPLPLSQMSANSFPILEDIDDDGDVDIFTPNDPTNATGNLQNGGGSTVPVSPLIAFALFAAGGFGVFRRNRKKNKV